MEMTCQGQITSVFEGKATLTKTDPNFFNTCILFPSGL